MGLPMGLQCTITAVGGVIMQWAVNGLGSSVVAAVTAAGKTQNLLSCALESIGTAMAHLLRARTWAPPGWTVCAAV